MASARPDVAIVDLALKSSSGLALVSELRKEYPALKILVFSMLSESIFAARALNAGAHGFLRKDEGTEKAVQAVRTLLQNRTFVSGQVEKKMFDHLRSFPARPSPAPLLTKREAEVLELLGHGLSSREIAQQLNLTFSSVSSHYQNLRKKLGLENGSELVHYALHWVHDQTRPRQLDLLPRRAGRQPKGGPTRMALG